MRYSISVFSAFVWTGFVCAISFMEAWLKFQAPGITVPLGLGIGKLVFNALNKVEWVFALVILIDLIWSRKNIRAGIYLLTGVLITLLLLQSFWLLPALDARADMHIQGQVVPSSDLHVYYVVMEVIKVLCLITLGFSILKLLINKSGNK